MDQHYDFQDAREWISNPSDLHFQILIQGCPGDRLEVWMETRNTKKRYRDQLCNFDKVSEPSYWTLIHSW